MNQRAWKKIQFNGRDALVLEWTLHTKQNSDKDTFAKETHSVTVVFSQTSILQELLWQELASETGLV